MHTFSEQGHPLALFPNRAPSSVLSGREMLQATTISGCRPWSATINPFPPQSSATLLRSVAAISANDVWAVGFTLQPPNDVALTLIEHWDGNVWQIIGSPSPQPSGNNDLLSVAAVKVDDVWAVGLSSPTPGARGIGLGQTLIEHWDGTSWQVMPSPSPGSVGNVLNAVAVVGADDVWAAGSFSDTTNPNGPLSTLIEHWDGTSWSVVPSPNPESNSEINGLAVVSASDIWAVGFSSPSLSTGPWHTLTEHWDGTSWSVVPSPNPASVIGAVINNILGVVAVSADDVWAVGFAANTFFSSNLFGTTLVEHWNGHEWQIVPSPNPGWGDSGLIAVAAISALDVWAVGAYTNNLPDASQDQTLVEHWNGHAWQVVPSESPGLLNNGLRGITRVPGTQTLWAVGQTSDTSQVLQPLSEFSC